MRKASARTGLAQSQGGGSHTRGILESCLLQLLVCRAFWEGIVGAAGQRRADRGYTCRIRGKNLPNTDRHSLHSLLRRLCSHMLDPPHSLHVLLMRLWGHMLDPRHSLHSLLRRLCSHMLDPPHSLHSRLRRPCSHFPEGIAQPALGFLPASRPSQVFVSGTPKVKLRCFDRRCTSRVCLIKREPT